MHFAALLCPQKKKKKILTEWKLQFFVFFKLNEKQIQTDLYQLNGSVNISAHAHTDLLYDPNTGM